MRVRSWSLRRTKADARLERQDHEGQPVTAKAAQVSVLGSPTVTDGSAAQTGVICSDYTGTAGLVVCVEENGALTMKGGRITTEGVAQTGNAV